MSDRVRMMPVYIWMSGWVRDFLIGPLENFYVLKS